MRESAASCVLCRGSRGDNELDRVQVWEDPWWRLTTDLTGEIAGFSYLEPKRHVPHITDLGGEEARTLGTTLARVTRALRAATASEVVYLYVFGDGIPHLHFHLAPHRRGDPLNDRVIRGELSESSLPNGARRFASKEFPALTAEVHSQARERIRQMLEATDACP